MKWPEIKYLLAILLSIFYSCEKSDFVTGEPATFNSAGKKYTFTQHNDDLRTVLVDIPAGAVTQQSYLLYQYTDFDDVSLITTYFINYQYNDINYFECFTQPLLVPATVTMPLKPNVTWYSTSGYKVYHVAMNPGDDYLETLNDPTKWTALSDFNVDNTIKTISFSTTNLQGIYVLAKEK
jgi:hypothetical protein